MSECPAAEKKNSFNLNKSEFRDRLHLRYANEPQKLPKTCPCSHGFTIAHALHCPEGGCTNFRYNKSRDIIAKFMEDVCHDVEIEPLLQPLQSESFDNKSTMREEVVPLANKKNGLWGHRFSR